MVSAETRRQIRTFWTVLGCSVQVQRYFDALFQGYPVRFFAVEPGTRVMFIQEHQPPLGHPLSPYGRLPGYTPVEDAEHEREQLTPQQIAQLPQVPLGFSMFQDIRHETNVDGCWLLAWGFYPRMPCVFYWTTRMKTVYQRERH